MGELRSSFSTAPFNNNFSVTKDMSIVSATTILGRYFVSDTYRWPDGGSDAFDGWGYFQIQNPDETIKTPIPLTPTNGPDGAFYTNTFTHDGVDWQVKHGWATSGIFIIEITQLTGDPKPFRVQFGGDVGSDSSTDYGMVEKSFTIGNQTFYLKTYWNNHGALDSTGGDPQITVTVVPFDPVLSKTTGDNMNRYRGGGFHSRNDAEVFVSATDWLNGCTIYIQWGYTSVDSVQNWIIADLTAGSHLQTQIGTLCVLGKFVRAAIQRTVLMYEDAQYRYYKREAQDEYVYIDIPIYDRDGQLAVQLNGQTGWINLLPTTDPKASAIRIQTTSDVKALELKSTRTYYTDRYILSTWTERKS